MNDYFKVYFDQKGVLHIAPRNNIEAMALKYWKTKYEELGDEAFKVETEAPINLSSD